MKKIGLMLFAFLAMSVCAMAQNEGRPARGERGGMGRMNREQMVKNMTDNQVKRLKLNKEQAAKMQVLNDSLMSSMMGGFGQGQRNNTPRREMSSEDRAAQRKAMETRMTQAREKYNKGVKAILTAEQYKEFEKMQNERPQGFRQGGQRGQGGQGRPGGQGGPRGNRGGQGGNFGGRN